MPLSTCQEAFRQWLKDKYQTLNALNKAWWTTFWSHRYTSWDQIESPALHGEMMLHGLNLDWYRFVSHQTLDFAKWGKGKCEILQSSSSCYHQYDVLLLWH